MRNFGMNDLMRKIVVGQRGIVTLPIKLRRRYGIKEHDELLAEETPQGLLLRPCVSMPIEIYSEDRIAEFEEDNEAIGKTLDALDADS